MELLFTLYHPEAELSVHLITAVYSGARIDFKTMIAVAHMINSGFTTITALTSSSNRSAYGQPVTFTATITSSGIGVAPSGTVTFQNYRIFPPINISTVALINGTATCTTTCLQVRTRSWQIIVDIQSIAIVNQQLSLRLSMCCLVRQPQFPPVPIPVHMVSW